MQERLQKIISAAGVTSRRAAEQLILDGRVRVNGKVVTELGSKADADKDHIKVDGKLINPEQPKTYLLLNKPVGYVTTMSDPEGRPIVQDLLKGIRVRVYPVGRLDYNTEGLLLLTNDGDFAHLITHPKHELPKTYLVKIKGVLSDEAVHRLESGIFLQDGKTAPARVKRLRKEEANSWVEITIHEGKKRQVRRMIDHTGNSVIRLKRVRVGNLPLGNIPQGAYRHLTGAEVKALKEMAEGVTKGPVAGVQGPGIAVITKPSSRKREAPEVKREPRSRPAVDRPRVKPYREDRKPFQQKREGVRSDRPRVSFVSASDASARPVRRHGPVGRTANSDVRTKNRGPFERRDRSRGPETKREPQQTWPTTARPRTRSTREDRRPFQQRGEGGGRERPRTSFVKSAAPGTVKHGPMGRASGGDVRPKNIGSFEGQARPKGNKWRKPAAGAWRTGEGKRPQGGRPQRPRRPGR